MDNKQLEKLIENLENIVPAITENSSDEEKQKVLEQINQAVQLAPEDEFVLTWKALYYQAIQDYDNAILAYQDVLKVKPND